MGAVFAEGPGPRTVGAVENFKMAGEGSWVAYTPAEDEAEEEAEGVEEEGEEPEAGAEAGEEGEDEDAADDDTLDTWLDEIEQQILVDVAWSGGNYDLTAAAIAQNVNENHVVTEHYVDQLVRRRFVYEKTFAGYPSTYHATPEGRRYLVEEDLV
jgi:predicted transcriptional regulator